MCFTSNRQRGHLETAPYLPSLAKDAKLGFYNVPTENRTPGHRVAVHYRTAVPCALHKGHFLQLDKYKDVKSCSCGVHFGLQQ